jgi:4-hydroxy-tetrahydrodipicolinate synthase
MLRLEGSFPAVATPFRKGALDEAAYRELCSWLLAEGSAGLVPCGTTGETPTLTRAEQDVCVRIAVEEARRAGKVVIAGAGTNDTRTTIERVREVKALGADAALVVTPWYNKPTQGGLVAHYAAVNDAVPSFPIVVYVVPGRTGVDLLPESYGKFREAGDRRGQGGDGPMQRVVETGSRSAIGSSSSPALHDPPADRAGRKRVISVSANVAEARRRAVAVAARRGRDRRRAAGPAAAAVQARSSRATDPEKAALHLMGRFGTRGCCPVLGSTEAGCGGARAGTRSRRHDRPAVTAPPGA